MLKKTIKLSVLTIGALFSLSALAQAGFKVPVHYNLELVDGKDSYDYSRFSRTLSLTPGKHQILVTFKDTFRSGNDSRLVQSIDPLVINIEDLKDDQVVTFQYQKPSNESQASSYIHKQKITLVDRATGKPLSAEEASYFILTSDKGFSLMRDYRSELISLNRLYEPNYVAGANRGLELTKDGAPTIRATSEIASADTQSSNQGLALEPLSGGDTSAMTTSRAASSSVNSATYNDLVKLYDTADDATKLKFVKYVMSH